MANIFEGELGCLMDATRHAVRHFDFGSPVARSGLYASQGGHFGHGLLHDGQLLLANILRNFPLQRLGLFGQRLFQRGEGSVTVSGHVDMVIGESLWYGQE